MPFLVRDRLFIGAINDAAEILQKGSTDITYILSVLSSASISFFSDWRSNISIQSKEIRRVFMSDNISRIPDKKIDSSVNRNSSQKLLYSLEMAGPELNLVRMAVPLRDMENENLLDYLDACLDFIDNSRKEGSVLVHCFAGVSRSAAVITAYLMRTEELSQEDALESLRMSCDFVCPNDGFLEQLKMFEEMGFKVDTSSSIYKRFRLKIMGDLYNRGEMIDTSTFGSDPGFQSEPVLYESVITPEMPKHVYRCKKCGRIVAIQDNVFEHVPGEGEKNFDWRKRKSGHPFDRSDEFPCSSLFIEPLQWMTAVKDGALEGKLSCIHCEARLGYFNWSGIQCSCGSWITPAFQLHKSRVDVSTS